MAINKIITVMMLYTISYCSSVSASFTEQVKKADNVVQGKVVGQRSEWVDSHIVTYHRVLVRDDLSATALNRANKSEIIISQPGGTARHPVLNIPVTQHISHQVALKAGDEAIYFTKIGTQGEQELVSGRAVVPIKGIGTERVTLPGFKQLVVKSKASQMTASSHSTAATAAMQSQAIFAQEPLTLTKAKQQIRKLLQQKAAVRAKNEK